jgi:hypothetical protein
VEKTSLGMNEIVSVFMSKATMSNHLTGRDYRQILRYILYLNMCACTHTEHTKRTSYLLD